MADSVAYHYAIGRGNQISQGMIPKLISCPELVQNPSDLVRVSNEVSRKFQAYKQVHRRPCHFTQIQQATSQHVIQNLLRWIPLEGNSDNLGCMTCGSQF